MYFMSTRDSSLRKSLSEAMQCGLAEDGGLFVPEYFPAMDLQQFSPEMSYIEVAQKILHAYFSDDLLNGKIDQICHTAFNFPSPLKKINDNTWMLELFHGPTSSFKDFGARFLAECLNILSQDKRTTIMVATSGDTGSAVASAFYQKTNIDVVILYPDKQITERQEHQITCWDTNIFALAVQGRFDDCQRLVKQAFQDPVWKKTFHLSSANSINIGRLLPQIVYYAYASLQFFYKYKSSPGFIVPTGNLGNATACYWAKMMGFPIREIALSTNANHVISDYLQTGEFQPRQSISTLANAMDVGNPSNFERLQYLYKTHDAFKQNVKATSVSDDEIKKTIIEIYQQYKTIICPHTATAFFARNQLSQQAWIVVATADPAKFDTVVEPLIHVDVPVAKELQALLDRPAHYIAVNNNLDAIRKIIEGRSDSHEK